MRRQVVLGTFASLLLVFACAGPQTPVAVTRFDATLVYFGPLTGAGLAALEAADSGTATTLLIRSGGGEVGVGIDFGEWIHARALDVVVDDFCVSSCANYVFTAGRRKVILPGSLVAWHGNAHLAEGWDDIAKMPASDQPRARAHMRNLRTREKTFFQRIAVSECIARIGSTRLDLHGFYTMSPQDMRRFGVRNVQGAPSAKHEVSERLRGEISFSFATVPGNLDAQNACP
jgi:hypothetical protein